MSQNNYGPVGSDVGTVVRFGDAMTARTLLGAESTAASFSVVEHLVGPRGLAAPLHMHSREDEFTIVAEGAIGFLLGEDVFYAQPGDLVRKPKNQWHTFWNAGDQPARVLEIITPSGFEHYFKEIAPFFPDGQAPDLVALAVTVEKYGLQMDFDSVPKLIKRFNLARR